MKINFVQNNYLLIWNLLYGPSISIKTHAFKQKLWLTYKKEYKAIEHDKDEILTDLRNFIPDNNTMYALFEDTKVFEPLERDTERHRLFLMKSWDRLKKDLNREFKDILRLDLKDYQVVVLHPNMDTCLTSDMSFNIAWGKKNDTDDALYTILQIMYHILKNRVKYEEKLDREIACAILELAILNECYTRLDKSNYLTGSKILIPLKRELYPYFLMYLGHDLEDTTTYMMRDNIAFDIERYTNEVQLRTLDIFAFIDFVVRNKKHILKLKKEAIEIL